MKCLYCNTNFITNSSLNNHMKTAKYCLKLRGMNIDEEYKCSCGKNFTQNSNYKTHLKTCSEKKIQNLKDDLELKNKEIERLQNFNQELQNSIQDLKNSNQDLQKIIIGKDILINTLQTENKIYKEEHDIVMIIAQQSRTNNINHSNSNNTKNTTNNKIMNITSNLNFNDIDYIKDLVENKYTIKHMLNGQKGFALFAIENLLRDKNGNLKYLCSDLSYHIFKYKDKNGELQKDDKAKKLSKYLIKGGIMKKFVSISNDWIKDQNGIIDKHKVELVFENQEDVMNFENDNNNFQKELAAIII